MPNPDAFTALGKHQTTFTNLDVFDRPEHVHDAIALGINPGGYSSPYFHSPFLPKGAADIARTGCTATLGSGVEPG